MNYEINAAEPARIAARIIRDHRPELAELNICYIWRDEAMSMGGGRVAAGQCVHTSDRDWAIHGFDFLILIARDVWAAAEARFKPALIDHELGHVGIRTDEETGEPAVDEETGRTRTFCKHHDLEEFSDVLERHGAYHSDIREFLASWGRHQPSSSAGEIEGGDDGQEE